MAVTRRCGRTRGAWPAVKSFWGKVAAGGRVVSARQDSGVHTLKLLCCEEAQAATRIAPAWCVLPTQPPVWKEGLPGVKWAGALTLGSSGCTFAPACLPPRSGGEGQVCSIQTVGYVLGLV